MTRLLIVRLGSLGDLVHTLPAVSAIRRALWKAYRPKSTSEAAAG